MLRPSSNPAALRLLRNAARASEASAGDLPLRNPTVAVITCWARTPSGHTTAPPSPAMNSRRLMRPQPSRSRKVRPTNTTAHRSGPWSQATKIAPAILDGEVRFGSWLCENVLAEALTPRGLVDVAWHGHFAEFCGFFVLESRLNEFPAVAACNSRGTHVGGYARIASRRGRTPMMFMTRVRL
jgi:hypothetical protein